MSAARLRGRGNEKAADQAAVDAMRRELNKLPIDGTVVIGEGERDEAPMLFIGEKVGNKNGPKVDIAVDPLEGTTLCAKNMPGSIAIMAMAEGGTLLERARRLHGQDRDRPGLSRRAWSISTRRRRRTSAASPRPRACKPNEITALHPRPAAPRRPDRRGAQDRRVGPPDHRRRRRRRHPHRPSRKQTGIDIYLGIGGAPEGVLAAAALRCIGGQMQGRLILDTEEKRERAGKMGIKDPRKKYDMEDMVRGDCLFAATGVTTGSMLRGVRFRQETDRDRDGGHALGHRHGALDPRRAPRAGEIQAVTVAPAGALTRRTRMKGLHVALALMLAHGDCFRAGDQSSEGRRPAQDDGGDSKRKRGRRGLQSKDEADSRSKGSV